MAPVLVSVDCRYVSPMEDGFHDSPGLVVMPRRRLVSGKS